MKRLTLEATLLDAIKKRELELELLKAEGKEAEYTAEVRADALEGLNDECKALQTRIWELEDAAAAEAAVSTSNESNGEK